MGYQVEVFMVVYEIVGGLVFIGLVAAGLYWLSQNITINKRRK